MRRLIAYRLGSLHSHFRNDCVEEVCTKVEMGLGHEKFAHALNGQETELICDRLLLGGCRRLAHRL